LPRHEIRSFIAAGKDGLPERLPSTNSKWPSSTCHTGFQYTPVASIATCSTPKDSSQSARASSPEVVVSKVRTCCNGAPSRAMRTQATTVCLCTSNPAQRGQMTSMIASVVACELRRHRRAAHVIEV